MLRSLNWQISITGYQKRKKNNMEELKIQQPDCQALNDLFNNFDINSIPKEKRDAMYKSYTKDYIMSLEYYDEDDDVNEILESNKILFEDENEYEDKKILPVALAIEKIRNDIPSLSEEQFITIKNNGIESLRIDSHIPIFWTQPIFSYIPDEYINIKIIDEKMMECGYINVRKEQRKDEDRRLWWLIIYNPNPDYMDDIRDVLDSYRLLHYTPEYNRDSILDSGLVPSKGGRTYFYPDARVFFIVTDKKRPFRFTNAYLKMMRNVSLKLKKKDRMFSGYFDCFELDMFKLPEGIKVFWDPNHEDGVYLNYHLEPDWLILHEDKSREF